MDNILLFSTRDELTRIRLERVMYFEADANYTKVVFSNGVTATLRQRRVLSDLASPYTATLSVRKDALRKLKALYTTPVRRSAADVEGVQPRPDGEAVSQ